MKNKITFGLDQWRLYDHMDRFLRTCSRKNIMVYEVVQQENSIVFYASVWQHKEIIRAFEQIEFCKTTGMIGFLLRSVRNPIRVLCVIVSVFCWYMLSHTIFEIDIKGEKQADRELIRTTLDEMGITPPFHEQDMYQIKADLKKTLENDIAWLEMVKQGSRYLITYTPKEFVQVEELSRNELIAQKDGVIARFDLQHGSKACKLNDFVHAGDVLVSNILIDSMNKNEEVFVKGKVYAYTWKDVEVTMEANDLPEAFQFFQLLFEARREASKELKEDEKIYKENILQFSNNMGTISMNVHYTLFEDITSP